LITVQLLNAGETYMAGQVHKCDFERIAHHRSILQVSQSNHHDPVPLTV